jgi:serine/threonine-protein kinase
MAAPSVHEGTLIKGYRIGRCLGTGSMGEVYEATNESNGKRVALKVLREGTEEALNASRRLLEEARAVNAIRHPGIVEVFDLGLMGEGRPFLVMELLEGLSLSARLKQGLFPVPDAIAVLEGMFDALGAAPPAQIRGVTQSPLHGVSFAHTFDNAAAPTLLVLVRVARVSVRAGHGPRARV